MNERVADTSRATGAARILLVLDDHDASSGIPDVERAAVHVLSFATDPDLVRSLEARLTARGCSVEVSSAERLLDDVALEVRQEFADIVAGYGRHIRGTSYDALFEDRLRLWWLNEVSGKRSDRHRTFDRLCQLELVRRAHAAFRPSRLEVLSDDPGFSAVLEDFARIERLQFATTVDPDSGDGAGARARTLIDTVADLAWLARTAVQAVLARLIAGRAALGAGRAAVAFFTHYPSMWHASAGESDEKYGTVPQRVAELTGKAPLMAVTLSSDGWHESATILQFVRRLRWYVRHRSSNLCLVDAYATPADFAIALRYVLRFRQSLPRHDDPVAAAYWTYHGISIFPLLRNELRFAARRTPRYLLLALRVRRFVDRVQPARFVTYLFEFCYGRALTYAVRTAAPGCAVIGVQHGPYAQRKLYTFHRPSELAEPGAAPSARTDGIPVPDWIIVEGTGAFERLIESGFEPRSIVIGGTPRLRRLWEISTPGEKPAHGSVTVLVAFGQHGARSILAACRTALRESADFHFLFKLHPRSAVEEGDVRKFLEGDLLKGSFEAVAGDIYGVLRRADVVVGTYSSVLMEAAALGYPVVCLHTPDRVNPTPLLDLPETPGVARATGATLSGSIDRVIRARGRVRSDLLREYFFGPAAPENRWAEAIMKPVGIPAEPNVLDPAEA